MEISEHFHLQVFLYQTILYIIFQSSIKGAFMTATTHVRLSSYKNRQQMLLASIMNV